MSAKTNPIKRSEQLKSLSREHHDGLLFTWKIRQGIGNGTDPDILKKFTQWTWENHLKPHFEQEENILLPYIEGHPIADQLKNEHEKIRGLVHSLNKDPGRSLFTSLASTLDEHIRFEERQFFGYIENKLSKDQLDVIATELSHQPVCEKKWKPEFWSRK
jgi:hemerythrin-like domain-containing protein